MKTEIAAALLVPFIALVAACGRQGREAEVETAGVAAGRVVLSPEALAAAGITLESASIRDFFDPVRGNGTAVLDPRFAIRVTPVVAGKIEDVFAYEGDRVRAGQMLAALYSPEHIAAQSEFLQILGADERSSQAIPETGRLLEAAREKLELLGMAPEEIAVLGKTRRVAFRLNLRAPISGTIIACQALRGAHHEANQTLYEIADLSRIWVEAGIHEKDLGGIAPGAAAEMEFTAYPGQTFSGRVTLISGRLDEVTRTVKARIELGDRSGRIKPGMFAAVAIRQSVPQKALAVPETALRNVEGRKVVFVPGGPGEFIPHEVRTGRTWEGWIEILSGLTAGERVVGKGSFLVKSELLKGRLNGE